MDCEAKSAMTRRSVTTALDSSGLRDDRPEFVGKIRHQSMFVCRSHIIAIIQGTNYSRHACSVGEKMHELTHGIEGAQVCGRYHEDIYNARFDPVNWRGKEIVLPSIQADVSAWQMGRFTWATCRDDAHCDHEYRAPGFLPAYRCLNHDVQCPWLSLTRPDNRPH